jgi:hypothetical protein
LTSLGQNGAVLAVAWRRLKGRVNLITTFGPGFWSSLQVSGTPSPSFTDDLRPLAGHQKEIRDANNHRVVSLRNSRAAGVCLRKWPDRA